MKRSQRLVNIIKIAEYQERKLAKQLAASRNTLKQYQEQLAMLDLYLNDYLKKLSTIKKNNQEVTINELTIYHDFIQTIEQGIQRQQHFIADASTVIQRHEQEWRKARAKVESFKHLQQKFKNAEDRELDRQEQRMIDDYVNRPR
ncbi:flagellar export protein FliJ [Piscirickettsia salmonis]|uniref:flagellar export protein FliJ n=1 Tax=Piscirickettsia salmonis TaxID=1238 RepID=UPI003752DB83